MEPEVSQGQGAPRLGRYVMACESGERDNNLERFELFEREVVGGGFESLPHHLLVQA